MIRKEGLPYIGVSLIFASVLYLFGLKTIAVLGLIACLFFLYFFRDPERIPPDFSNFLVSPADGKVIMIRQGGDSLCPQNYTEISIFMSPFDVHVNRIPWDGIVKKIIYTPGKFFSAFKDKAYRENENIKITLNTPQGDIIIRQVAGIIARRAICWINEGDKLKKGDRFGMIKFSSRVDICLPSTFKIKIKEGQKVKAGQSVIASL